MFAIFCHISICIIPHCWIPSLLPLCQHGHLIRVQGGPSPTSPGPQNNMHCDLRCNIVTCIHCRNPKPSQKPSQIIKTIQNVQCKEAGQVDSDSTLLARCSEEITHAWNPDLVPAKRWEANSKSQIHHKSKSKAEFLVKEDIARLFDCICSCLISCRICCIDSYCLSYFVFPVFYALLGSLASSLESSLLVLDVVASLELSSSDSSP